MLHFSTMTKNVAAITCIVCLSITPLSSSFFAGTATTTKTPRCVPPTSSSLLGYLDNLNNTPVSSDDNPNIRNEQTTADNDDDDAEDTGGTLKAARFSIFAPDANTLDATEFREQLKDNMKAELERRRARLPNRGSQAAKNYLDNL